MAQMNNWLSISKTEGKGDATITLTASSSTELEEKIARLKIQGITKTKHLEVTQDAYSPYIEKGQFYIEPIGDITLELRDSVHLTQAKYFIIGESTEWQSIIDSITTDKKIYIKDLTYLRKHSADGSRAYPFNITGNFNVGGDITTLLGEMEEKYEGVDTDVQYAWGLFGDCTGLINAEKLILPSIVSYKCYRLMFINCTSLTKAPALPATKMAEDCYSAMFKNCRSLTTPPQLPATELADFCYYEMFYNSGLTTAPELPATELAYGCYQYMFKYNPLTTAPYLPATDVLNKEYVEMFYGCGKLNYVNTALENWDSESLKNWLYVVAKNGTFVKKYWVSDDIVPSGWEIVNDEVRDFYIEPIDNITIKLVDIKNYNTTAEYKIGENGNWVNIDSSSQITSSNERIYLRNLDYYRVWNDEMYPFNITGKFNIGGSLYSLLGSFKESWAVNLFANTDVVDASDLIIERLYMKYYCYCRMFYNCKSLTISPKLTLSNLFDRSYMYLFYGCSNLKYIECYLESDSVLNNSLDLFKWVEGVSPTGTFVKKRGIEWPTATSSNDYIGIPEGWTIEEID